MRADHGSVQDSNQLHRGGVNRAVMPTGKMKGNTPDDFQQALWAPFMYFVPGIAGTCIGISNKLGSWTLPVNYACKGVCDMVYTVVTQHLSCLIDDEV